MISGTNHGDISKDPIKLTYASNNSKVRFKAHSFKRDPNFLKDPIKKDGCGSRLSDSKVSAPAHMDICILGRKAELHQRQRKEKLVMQNMIKPVEFKAKIKAWGSDKCAHEDTIKYEIPALGKKTKWIKSVLRKDEAEKDSTVMTKQMREINDVNEYKLDERRATKFETHDESGETNMMLQTKNEKIFERRGRQIEIQLPSCNDSHTETGDNLIYENCANTSQPTMTEMKRIYLVNQKSPFGLSKEKSFTVVFPDEVDNIEITKIPSSNPISPGWLSPVPFSKVDLSLAYYTPEHSPLTSPSPTMDHVSRLKPTFFRR